MYCVLCSVLCTLLYVILYSVCYMLDSGVCCMFSVLVETVDECAIDTSINYQC